jgi:hypothetical protein
VISQESSSIERGRIRLKIFVLGFESGISCMILRYLIHQRILIVSLWMNALLCSFNGSCAHCMATSIKVMIMGSSDFFFNFIM